MASKDWYSTTLVALAVWWANFILRRPEFENKYLILKNKQAELNAIGAWIAYWVATRHTFDEMSTQLSQYFATIAGNDPSKDPPLPITWALPPGTPGEVPPGIEAFIREVRREVVGSSNYAKADGEALGFEANTAPKPPPSEVKPTVKAFAATHGYGVSLVISGREGAVVADVYVTRKGGVRTKHATLEGKAGDITIEPTVPGDAEQLQIDVQLRKNNANYGQPSNPVYVTINP